MGRKFYAADLHFGHANGIKYDSRPFSTVEEMDRELIRIWNERVGDEDEVYILGDVCWNSQQTQGILAALKGRKHLILGNHDDQFRKDPARWSTWLETIVPYAEVEDGGVRVVLSHYPMMAWNFSMRGSVHLYGHVHATTPEACELAAWKKDMAQRGKTVKSWNVGIMMPYMAWGPRTLEEIMAASGEL